jgi:RNA polymerase sigma factor (sigma-70 family)
MPDANPIFADTSPKPADCLAQDLALAQAALRNEPGAFERLVAQYQRLVWHVVQRTVHHTEDARELCQEAFLRVHANLRQYRGESRLGTWIARVAYHLALRHLERKRSRGIQLELPTTQDEAPHPAWEPATDADGVEQEVSAAQTQRLLHAALQRLEPMPRLLLTLYHLEELPIAELANITGLAEGTIKSHLFRSRKQLRALLATQFGVEP